MRQAISGDSVLVNYTGTLDDGTEFDSSVETGPIEITIGGGRFFSGIENTLIGMTDGDTKKVILEPEDAFGEYNPQLIQNFERELMPPEIKLEIGTVLEAKNESGELAPVKVVEISDKNVTIDTNHPLVDKALTFELTLVGFVDDTA